jgi:hypothetical protein
VSYYEKIMKKNIWIGAVAIIAVAGGCSFGLINFSSAVASTGTGAEMGAWEWNPVTETSATAQQQAINNAAANHFTAIYLSLGDFFEQQPTQLTGYENKLETFLKLASQKHIVVDAEAGASSWSTSGNTQAAQILAFVQTFNQSHAIKFRGVQYDIEPYTLPVYATDPTDVLTEYVSLAESLVKSAAQESPALPISFDIPFFYDSATDATPVITLDGVTEHPYEQLLRVLGAGSGGISNHLLIMAYRNSAGGAGGTISLVQNEISEANETNVKILIAQETGPATPSYVTFYGLPKSTFTAQAAQIGQAFSPDSSYGGISVEDLDTYLQLK